MVVVIVIVVIVMVVRHAGVGLFFFILSFDPVLYKFEMHDIIIKECSTIYTNIAKELVFY